jgi:hypothetical protein
MCRYVISIRRHRASSSPVPNDPRAFAHFFWEFSRSFVRSNSYPKHRHAVIIDSDAGSDDLMAIALV